MYLSMSLKNVLGFESLDTQARPVPNYFGLLFAIL